MRGSTSMTSVSLAPEWTMRLVSVYLPGAPATRSNRNVVVLSRVPERMVQRYAAPSGAHAGSTRWSGSVASIRTWTSWDAASSFT